MCIICKLWHQGKLTTKEANDALTETIRLLDDENDEPSDEFDHIFELAFDLEKALDEEEKIRN